jgi:hypothetical protein
VSFHPLRLILPSPYPLLSPLPRLWTTWMGSQYIMPFLPADHPTMPKLIVFYFIVFNYSYHLLYLSNIGNLYVFFSLFGLWWGFFFGQVELFLIQLRRFLRAVSFCFSSCVVRGKFVVRVFLFTCSGDFLFLAHYTAHTYIVPKFRKDAAS